MKNILREEHSGAVAFEYIIILVIMAVVIFVAWKVLGNQVVAKANDIANFIKNNGTTQMGTSGDGGNATTPFN